jgi:hypothetical protein
MGRALYGHHTDNVAPNATVTVNTGTEDATYPGSNLVDRNPAKPAQLTTTTGSWVLDFGAAQRVDLVLLPMHNLTAGLEVRVQMHASNSWGSPTVNALIVIPAYREDGMPIGSWVDLTAAGGYSTGGFRYLRLNVVGTNAAAVKVGELLALKLKRTLNPNISWGISEPEERLVSGTQTDGGVEIVFDQGVTLQKFRGSLDTTDAGLAAVRSWWRDCRGPVYPSALVPDEDVNEAWVVRHAGTLDPTRVINDRNAMNLEFREVSRGLYL